MIKSYSKKEKEIIILVENIEKCDSIRSNEIYLQINNLINKTNIINENNNDKLKINDNSDKVKTCCYSCKSFCEDVIFFICGIYSFYFDIVDICKKRFLLKVYGTLFLQFFIIQIFLVFDYNYDWNEVFIESSDSIWITFTVVSFIVTLLAYRFLFITDYYKDKDNKR